MRASLTMPRAVQALTQTCAMLFIGVVWGVAAATALPLMYVANNQSDTLTVINAGTNEVVLKALELGRGEHPFALAITPNGAFLFVAGTQAVFSIEVDTNKVVAKERTRSTLLDLALDPGGLIVYVVNTNGTFAAFDVSDPTKLRIGAPPDAAAQNDLIRKMDIVKLVPIVGGKDTERKSVHVAGRVKDKSHEGRVVAVLVQDGLGKPLGQTAEDVETFVSSDGKRPAEIKSVGALAVTPKDGRYVAVGFQRENSDSEVWILDTKDGKILGKVPVGTGAPRAIAFSPDGKFAFAVTSDGSVWVIDAVKQKKETTARIALQAPQNVAINPQKIAITPDGALAFVLDGTPSGIVWVIDTTSKGVREVMLQGTPRAIAITGDSKLAYVTLGRGGQAGFAARLEIDPTKRTVKAAGGVEVGRDPQAIIVVPEVGKFGPFKGSAKPVEQNGVGDATVRLSGGFTFPGRLDLASVMLVLDGLLVDEEGAVELVRRDDEAPALPVLLLARAGSSASGAIYESAQSRRPAFRMEIKTRNAQEGSFEFNLSVSRATIPVGAARCEAGEPVAPLTTSIALLNPSFVVQGVHEWSCSEGDLRTPRR